MRGWFRVRGDTTVEGETQSVLDKAIQVNRRAFRAAVPLALLASPLTGEAQPAGKVSRIAFLGASSSTLESDLVAAFRQGLRDLGYIEGQNIVIEYRWTEGHYDRYPAFVAEAVSRKVDVIITEGTSRIVGFATKRRLPGLYPYREFVEAGGLASYAPSYPAMFRRAATYVDKIFKGAKPGELPIEQPTKFELTINLKAAKVLGLTIPQSVLGRADETIQ